MQIREQARRIQCIRAAYDPELKRCPQKLVFSFPRGTTPLPADLALLTLEEQQQLDAWLKQQAEEQKRSTLDAYAVTAYQTIDKITEAMNAGLAIREPDRVWASMARLAKSLKKAGYPKPRKTSSTKRPDTNDQVDFFDIQNYL